MEYKDLDELRAKAKSAGIPNTHLKGEERLLKDLSIEPVVEKPVEEIKETIKPAEEINKDGTIKVFDFNKSEEMQKNGYEVVGIKSLGFDQPSCHILKKVNA